MPTLLDGIEDGRDIAPGLGFIGQEVFVDQHLLVRGRFARMLPAMLARHYRIGLGIDENTAAVVTAGHLVDVIGYKGALLLDLSQASNSGERANLHLTNARISYLDSGDRVDLASGRFTPGADKEKVDPKDPSYSGPLFSSDVFGNTTVVDLLWKLCDSDQARAVGIAYGGPDSERAGPRLRIHLHARARERRLCVDPGRHLFGLPHPHGRAADPGDATAVPGRMKRRPAQRADRQRQRLLDLFHHHIALGLRRHRPRAGSRPAGGGTRTSRESAP